MSSDIVTIGVGSAGTRLGARLLKRLFSEVGASDSGSPFFVRANGLSVARAVFVDPDPSQAARLAGWLETSNADALHFHPEYIVSGERRASRSFARGLALADELMDKTSERIRKIVDESEVSAFLLVHSLGGGSGSGLTSGLLNHLVTTWRRKPVIAVAILPSAQVESSPLDVVNTALGLSALEHANAVILTDNDAAQAVGGVRHAKHRPLNKGLAPPLNAMMAALQLGVKSATDLLDELVPIPRLNLLCPAHVVDEGSVPPSLIQGERLYVSLPKQAWDARAALSATTFWRGAYESEAVGAWIEQARAWTSWASLVDEPLRGVIIDAPDAKAARSVSALINHQAVSDLIEERVVAPFRAMVEHEAYLPRQIELGLAADAPAEALGNLEALVRDYREPMYPR
jgi:hypothetical protein